MSAAFILDALPTSPFRSINGVDYSIWSYKLSWSAAISPSGPLALVLPGSIDVQDPTLYPDQTSIQGCTLFRSLIDMKLYVSVPAPPPPKQDVTISFITPSASTTGMALSVVERDATTESWNAQPFSVGAAGDVALIQMVEGPEVKGFVPSSPDLAKPRGGSRRVPKATLVSIQTPSDQLFREQGAAIEKYNFLQRLNLSNGETNEVAAHLKVNRDALAVIRSFEGLPTSSTLPTARDVAKLPTTALLEFGQAVVDSRKARIQNALPASAHGQAPTVRSGQLEIPNKTKMNPIIDYQSAFTALKSFRNAFEVSPIGLLNLERLEMTPAGIQRGELIATIPLAPKEKTTVTHKEWSVTSQEFTSIVTDSLENYSETGVTENSELAQATNAQTTHNNQFNINASVSGSYGPVTATVATSFGAQDAESQSASESRKHAVTTTRSASSRVKQEHKVTVSTTTTTGSLDASMRHPREHERYQSYPCQACVATGGATPRWLRKAS